MILSLDSDKHVAHDLQFEIQIFAYIQRIREQLTFFNAAAGWATLPLTMALVNFLPLLLTFFITTGFCCFATIAAFAWWTTVSDTVICLNFSIQFWTRFCTEGKFMTLRALTLTWWTAFPLASAWVHFLSLLSTYTITGFPWCYAASTTFTCLATVSNALLCFNFCILFWTGLCTGVKVMTLRTLALAWRAAFSSAVTWDDIFVLSWTVLCTGSQGHVTFRTSALTRGTTITSYTALVSNDLFVLSIAGLIARGQGRCETGSAVTGRVPRAVIRLHRLPLLVGCSTLTATSAWIVHLAVCWKLIRNH